MGGCTSALLACERSPGRRRAVVGCAVLGIRLGLACPGNAYGCIRLDWPGCVLESAESTSPAVTLVDLRRATLCCVDVVAS